MDRMTDEQPDDKPQSEESDFARLRRLVEFLKESGIAEFSSERDGQKVSIKFAGAPGSAQLDPGMLAAMMARTAPPAAPAPPPSAAETRAATEAAEANEEANWHIVKSPIVGTFYESPSPGASAFVNIGDRVENGQVLCIVEAMKLMNEIESDGAGEIVKRYVQNGQPIEYGQKLFALKG